LSVNLSPGVYYVILDGYNVSSDCGPYSISLVSDPNTATPTPTWTEAPIWTPTPTPT